MQTDDIFDPAYWTLTPQPQPQPKPRRPLPRMRARQATILGLAQRHIPFSIWRAVAQMEAELMAGSMP